MKPKPSHILLLYNVTDNLGLVKRTSAFWEQRLGRPATAEETRKMIENVIGYFTLLAEWDSA
ncbi:MAG: hypothetical protein JZU65_03895 [Chlorobium sp.]|nr:hypothetical protein [Chlorobium sp.]